MKENKLSKFAKFFIAYGEYHNNKINRLIHLVCIPLIYFSLFGLMQFINYRYFFVGSIFEINPASIFFFVISLLNLYVNIYAGLLTIIWNLFLYILGKILFIRSFKKNSSNEYFQVVLIIHLFAWIAQFIGHGIFEKRAPALCNNIFLVFNAPFFITVEILKDFGWKKEEFKIIDKIINQKIQIFKKEKSMKKKK